MRHDAIVVFTAKSREEILAEGGSRDWRLDPVRARRAEFLVCTQNRHNTGLAAPTAPHGQAFLIGRISAIVPSPQRPDRWLVNIRDYIACDIPNIWGRNGHLRYPVWYTTLEDLGIELDHLPAFAPLPSPHAAGGLSDATGARLVPAQGWAASSGDQDAWARMDAILAQLDRVPDLPSGTEPLDWDEQGLPR
jgi:hypothetical protein